MTTNKPFVIAERCSSSPRPSSPLRHGRRLTSWTTTGTTGKTGMLAALAVVGALGAGCDATTHVGKNPGSGSSVRVLPSAHAPLTATSQLDLLFMIDDSQSMAPLQQKMRTRLANFMDVLKNLPGGLPDIHVAVVSSSLGAGIFSNVPGCAPNSAGNLDGEFQHSAVCTALHAGSSYLSSFKAADGTQVNNFDGDITDVFGCIANLGDHGCGFEHQLAATQLSLERAMIAGDTNSGFLRDDAYLAIVMLTNEDDCSVSGNSTLFDPAQQTVSDYLGGLSSYRCNEFGHLCDGQSPPHDVGSLPQTLMSCVSNETATGRLVHVNDFIDFLFALKPANPEKIFVAAMAGPVTPYVVTANLTEFGAGEEPQPGIQHSCSGGTANSEYADPAVRIRQMVSAFGPNSYFGSICADDFGPTMESIAQVMVAP